ncbi:MAG: redoxin domain-containing protein [Propionibacteriales bacterium]|nr:redoxin domain-containing protein [Propionibacteriales bacterium]
MTVIEVGDKAPDFALKDQHGETVSLADFRGDKAVLLVFYPWSFTGVCTGEMCEIRDALPDLEGEDAQVLAVSCDAMPTQRVYADQEGLTFPVLSDFWPHGEVATAYGVFDAERGTARRGTFAIDRDGVVRWRVVTGLREPRTVSDYRAVLRELSA